MDTRDFLALVEKLTGRPVKELGDAEQSELGRALADDGAKLDWTQFNELLLLVNKDRVEAPFYDRYFGRGCLLTDLRAGVQRFQIDAMLQYGNFVYAYRRLSQLKSNAALLSSLGDICRDPEAIIKDLKSRSRKLLEITPIPRRKTFLVGYLSARQRTDDLLYADTLVKVASDAESWEQLEQAIAENCSESHAEHLSELVSKHRAQDSNVTFKEFIEELNGDVLPKLQAGVAELEAVQNTATRNQDIYLTWDHMDVYFATSMRKRSEYEDLHGFVQALMGEKKLAELNVRYFDPTQSFTSNRVNKGLVEALMLRRAKCTIYSIQETDTLGKDSELASTLAQGKPVIAYVPEIDVDARAKALVEENDPLLIAGRIESVPCNPGPEDEKFIRGELREFADRRVWQSLPDPDGVAHFTKENGPALERLARVIAESEAALYNSRARTLKELHPLGIQVNLQTGVANGVLVVRTIPDCAELLRRVLTNTLEFDLVNSESDGMWYLREKVSGSAFRVVTHDRKLTNCFWNFYTRESNYPE